MAHSSGTPLICRILVHQTTGVPRLPPEVTDHIIACVEQYETSTLLNCCLVCATWLPASRHQLFKCIALSSPESYDLLVSRVLHSYSAGSRRPNNTLQTSQQHLTFPARLTIAPERPVLRPDDRDRPRPQSPAQVTGPHLPRTLEEQTGRRGARTGALDPSPRAIH